MSQSLKSPLHMKTEALQLAKTVGDFIQYWGFSNLYGQIWCLIYISQKPLSGQELASLLGVSKGAVSLAIQELMFYEVIIPSNRGPKNTIYYTANPDIESVICNVLKNRELKLIEASQQALQALLESEQNQPQQQPLLNWNHLESLKSMILIACQFLKFIIQRRLEINSVLNQNSHSSSDKTNPKA